MPNSRKKATNRRIRSASAEIIADALRADGDIAAYPCEGVWGLGCDPQNHHAVSRLLRLKEREEEQGLILIAGKEEHLKPYIQPDLAWNKALSLWNYHPVTCLLTASDDCPSWLSGMHTGTLAARITTHPPARQLCLAFGDALTSTSANISGQPPARTAAQVRELFATSVPWLLEGEIGTLGGATPIYDPARNRWLRTSEGELDEQ